MHVGDELLDIVVIRRRTERLRRYVGGQQVDVGEVGGIGGAQRGDDGGDGLELGGGGLVGNEVAVERRMAAVLGHGGLQRAGPVRRRDLVWTETVVVHPHPQAVALGDVERPRAGRSGITRLPYTGAPTTVNPAAATSAARVSSNSASGGPHQKVRMKGRRSAPSGVAAGPRSPVQPPNSASPTAAASRIAPAPLRGSCRIGHRLRNREPRLSTPKLDARASCAVQPARAPPRAHGELSTGMGRGSANAAVCAAESR